MQSKVCSNCRKENPGDMFFCMHCGALLPESTISEAPTLMTGFRGNDRTLVLRDPIPSDASETRKSHDERPRKPSGRTRIMLIGVAGLAIAFVSVTFFVVRYGGDGRTAKESQEHQSTSRLDIEIRPDWEVRLKRDLSDSPPSYFPHAIESRSLYFEDPSTRISYEFHAGLFATGADALDGFNNFATRNNAQKVEGFISDSPAIFLTRKVSPDSVIVYFVTLGQPDNRPIVTVWSSSDSAELSRFQDIVKIVK